ncbi:MAG: hypothetical protein CMJ84_11640 [Planctomycetes bacterium]|nr:hypothetical protein [Planctomycetota bacterium]
MHAHALPPRRGPRLASALALALALTAPLALPQDQGGPSREQAALGEEQSLLLRKLGRLRGSMEHLAERFDAEGRAHAAGLLRDGLSHVDERALGGEHRTLEELMTTSLEDISGGQSVSAIRGQEETIRSLERLLAILMDRPDLDQLERKLEELHELQARLTQLADAEQTLADDTEVLRRDSSNAAQNRLAEGIQHALAGQRGLLAENEKGARESGALRLEELEHELARLREDQQEDLERLAAWEPERRGLLTELARELELARGDAARAERLEEAAEQLGRSAAAAAEGGRQRADAAAELERAAERGERAARASEDESARRTAEALRAALEAIHGEGDGAEVAEALEQTARELAAAGARQRSAARERTERAADELERNGGRNAEAALARAAAAALDERNGAEADADEALRRLRRGLEELALTDQRLAASQERNSQRARELATGLAQLPQGGTSAGERAGAALDQAARAMGEAAGAAAAKGDDEAEEAARRAEQALARAQAAVRDAREGTRDGEGTDTSGDEGEDTLARRQEELAREVDRLESEIEQASMGPAGEAAVREALERAGEAMRRASGELSGQRSSAAARSQREAIESLGEAAREADEGVVPKNEAERERAAELAQRQEEIAKRLFEFMQRYEERGEQAPPLPSMQAAQESAGQAHEALEQGELGEAQDAEAQAEQEIREAIEQLEDEEEQYQRLRDEELLFRITEEVEALSESHAELMEQTEEADAGRAGDPRPTRSLKLRLRKLAREEQALANRAGGMREAIEEEESLVFAELLGRIESDLVRIARDMGEVGGYRSDERVQLAQSEVARSLRWLGEALAEEKERRAQQQQQQQQQQSANRLVPDVAELKLLRRMEVEVLDSIDELLELYPQLAESDPQDLDPLLLEDILRLAHRHERTSGLFGRFRARLGLPDPDEKVDTESSENEAPNPERR